MPKVKLTAQERETIAGLYGGSETAKQIGERFGISESHVKKLWMFRRERENTGPYARRGSVLADRTGGFNFLSARLAPRIIPPDEQAMIDDMIVVGGKTLMDLQEGDCRWPLGVDQAGGRRFCGCQRTHRMYCDTHATTSVGGVAQPVLKLEHGMNRKTFLMPDRREAA